MSEDDPFSSGAFGATKSAAKDKQRREKGHFEFPERTVDLIDLFLDPCIQAARAELHREIENAATPNTQMAQAGVVNMTPLAKQVQKAVVDIHALQKQAQRDRRKR